MNPRRLYRCRHDRSLAGVAAGMAEYLDLDPTVVRVLWILAAVFSGGLAILLYIILAFVMPMEPATAPAGGPTGFAGPERSTGYAAPEPGAEFAQGADFAEGAEATPDDATRTWTGPSGEQVASAWAQAPGHEHRARSRGDGRAGLAIGILLVVFGAIALTGPLFPGWVASVALGPAFILALGVALVIVAARRPAPES